MLNAQAIKDWLKMAPNVQEGGFLSPVYQSSVIIPDRDLKGFKASKHGRAICGAIYYLLESPGCSVLHRVTGDMIYHFYGGDPVQMLLLHPRHGPGRSEVCVFGNNLVQRQSPMKVVPGGTWLGSRLMPGGSWALMGVTMAPGFDPKDYAIGDRKRLIKEFPEQTDLITQLTRCDFGGGLRNDSSKVKHKSHG
jgi:predicted cupin superfamily sugar epimerase